MDNLVEKYRSIVSEVDEGLRENYAIALEECVNYLKNKDITIYQKLGSSFILKELFLKDKNFTSYSNEEVIDKFIEYYNEEYDNYIDSLEINTDKFHADYLFYNRFVKKWIKMHQQ